MDKDQLGEIRQEIYINPLPTELNKEQSFTSSFKKQIFTKPPTPAEYISRRRNCPICHRSIYDCRQEL